MTARTCPGCGCISFTKGARNCNQCGSPLDFNPVLVSYKPEGARVNGMVKALNDMVPSHTPEQMAAFVASTIAACAYIMLEMNSPATIKEVFGVIIDDAMKQRKARAKKVSN